MWSQRRRSYRALLVLTVVLLVGGLLLWLNNDSGRADPSATPDGTTSEATNTATTTTEAPAPPRPPRVILLQQAPPLIADVVGARESLETLPIQGLVIRSSVSSTVMGGARVDAAALAREFAPMTPGMFTHLTDNFALVYAAPAGPYSEFSRVVAENFAVLAHVARASGFAGIFFDVEEYFGPTWSLAEACPGQTLDVCRQAAQDAGLAVMRAIVKEWPTVQLFVTTGASVSEPLTAKALNPPTIAATAEQNLTYGSFAVGLVRGADGTRAKFIDGAGGYTQNVPSDVDRLVRWVSKGMAEKSPLIPDSFRARYQQIVSPAPGVFDFPVMYQGKGPGSPSMWMNDIAITLPYVKDYLWLYSERFNWGASSIDTDRPTPPLSWLQATSEGIRVGRGG